MILTTLQTLASLGRFAAPIRDRQGDALPDAPSARGEPEGLRKTAPVKMFPDSKAIKSSLGRVYGAKHSGLTRAFTAISILDDKPSIEKRITAEAPPAIALLKAMNAAAVAIDPHWDGAAKIALLERDWATVNPGRALVTPPCDIGLQSKAEVLGGMWAMAGEVLGNREFAGRYAPPPAAKAPFGFISHDHAAVALRRCNDLMDTDETGLDPNAVANGARKVFDFEIAALSKAG